MFCNKKNCLKHDFGFFFMLKILRPTLSFVGPLFRNHGGVGPLCSEPRYSSAVTSCMLLFYTTHLFL